MRTVIAVAASILAVSVVAHSPARAARPLRKADVVGKSICWRDKDGAVEKFSAGGKLVNSVYGPGTWLIDRNGVWKWTLNEFPGTFTGKKMVDDDGSIIYVGDSPWGSLNIIGEFCHR